MIKAITFDFWQTLYADSPELNDQRSALRTSFCDKFLTERGYSCSAKDIVIGFEAAYAHVHELWYEHRGVTVSECMLKLTETLQIHLDAPEIEALIEAVGAAFFKAPPIVVPYAKVVLARLAAKYQLAVISDAGLTPGRLLRRLMAQDGILDYFTVQTFSDETPHTKPEVVQFHSTLASLNVKPTEAVHIGDIVRTDIVGAKNAGMKAIRFSGVNPREQEDNLSDATIDDYRQLEATIDELIKK